MTRRPLKSYGCSFMLGSELSDWSPSTPDVPSRLTFPSLIASNFGLEYICRARGAQGNLSILCSIISSMASRRYKENHSVWIINWTYIDRFDHGFDNLNPRGKTILPTDQTPEAKLYYKFLHTQNTDLLRTLNIIYTAITALRSEQIPFMMTYMDPIIFDKSWADPGVIWLQQQIKPFLYTFEGMDFLTWSKHKGFPVGALNHPLDEAHAAAADYLMPTIESILRKA